MTAGVIYGKHIGLRLNPLCHLSLPLRLLHPNDNTTFTTLMRLYIPIIFIFLFMDYLRFKLLQILFDEIKKLWVCKFCRFTCSCIVVTCEGMSIILFANRYWVQPFQSSYIFNLRRQKFIMYQTIHFLSWQVLLSSVP